MGRPQSLADTCMDICLSLVGLGDLQPRPLLGVLPGELKIYQEAEGNSELHLIRLDVELSRRRDGNGL